MVGFGSDMELGRLPLDVTMDELVSDSLSVPKVLEALERAGWTLPLVPGWLAERMPDLFKTAKTAENWARQTLRGRWRRRRDTPCRLTRAPATAVPAEEPPLPHRRCAASASPHDGTERCGGGLGIRAPLLWR